MNVMHGVLREEGASVGSRLMCAVRGVRHPHAERRPTDAELLTVKNAPGSEPPTAFKSLTGSLG